MNKVKSFPEQEQRMILGSITFLLLTIFLRILKIFRVKRITKTEEINIKSAIKIF